MLGLLEDPVVIKDFATAYPSIEKVIFQLQRDLVNEENRDKIGPTIHALGEFQNLLVMFQTAGDIQNKQKQKKQP